MFTVIKPFDIHEEFKNHDISWRNFVVDEGFNVSVNVQRKIPFLGGESCPPILTYKIFDRSNPDDFYAFQSYFVATYFVATYMTVLVSRKNRWDRSELLVDPTLTKILNEVVDKRGKTCYDVVKAKQR